MSEKADKSRDAICKIQEPGSLSEVAPADTAHNLVRLRHSLEQNQREWGQTPLRQRLRILRRFRRLLWRELPSILKAIPDQKAVDVITAEILPLHAAARFLAREASSLLADTRPSARHRPIWLWGVRSRVIRRPHGTVLILAPGNYPLMLAGVQVLQALIAGNAVALKPAPGRAAITALLIELLTRAGLPAGLVERLTESCGSESTQAGFDLIILTGSALTGRAVAAAAAKTLTPTIMELSGADPVFVLPSADLSMVARALQFGMTLKGGHTCIAPRRVYVTAPQRDRLEQHLTNVFGAPKTPRGHPGHDALNALQQTIRQAGGEIRQLEGVTVFFLDQNQAPLADIDLFAPWFAIITTQSMEDAIGIEQKARHALGASIFGAEPDAQKLARQIPAGTIVINDLIVPSADPRLPFGGARESGFGVTRGREGLLAMTRPVSISTRKRLAFHLLPRLRFWHGR